MKSLAYGRLYDNVPLVHCSHVHGHDVQIVVNYDDCVHVPHHSLELIHQDG